MLPLPLSPLHNPRDHAPGVLHTHDPEANPCALVPSGTLTSITNLATSLARNMDRLSLDEEHYNRQEEWRRQPPESLGEGLQHGLSRLGISLLGKGCGDVCSAGPLALRWGPAPRTRWLGNSHPFCRQSGG